MRGKQEEQAKLNYSSSGRAQFRPAWWVWAGFTAVTLAVFIFGLATDQNAMAGGVFVGLLGSVVLLVMELRSRRSGQP